MIRKFKEEDTTKVMTIWTKGNFKAHNFIEKDYWLEIFNKVKNEFLFESETYVYEEGNEIKGFVSVFNNNEIKALFVKQDSQRKGIGRKLINYCKERYNYLTLDVYEKNINAVLFFIALNFKNTNIKIDEKMRRKKVPNAMGKIISINNMWEKKIKKLDKRNTNWYDVFVENKSHTKEVFLYD